MPYESGGVHRMLSVVTQMADQGILWLLCIVEIGPTTWMFPLSGLRNKSRSGNPHPTAVGAQDVRPSPGIGPGFACVVLEAFAALYDLQYSITYLLLLLTQRHLSSVCPARSRFECAWTELFPYFRWTNDNGHHYIYKCHRDVPLTV